MEDKIRAIVYKELKKLGADGVTFAVEWPADPAHGDFAVNAAMAASKALGRNSSEIAQDILHVLKTELGCAVSDISVAGPGFINITLSQKAITKIVDEAIVSGADWGRGTERSGQKVLVEYSCPNPFKEMHIGHLMSTVIGESISRLIENQGAHVVRDTYGGDVGPHVAKTLWALEKSNIRIPADAEELGRAYTHGARSYGESEKAKVEIDLLNTKLYEILESPIEQLETEDRELRELWRIGRDVSLSAYTRLWDILGTHFDYTFFESETSDTGLRVVGDGLEKGIFEKSEGAVIYNGEKQGLHTLVFITSRGTPTYETKDIGLAFLKEERIAPDYSYIITANEQIGHFKVFLAALKEIAPKLADYTEHIPHGLLRLASGKMSSREGNIITAEQLIHDVLIKASNKNEDPLVASSVGLGAIKYMILRQSTGGDVIFDFDRSLSLEGDSGPYLQYSVARAMSILGAGKEKLTPDDSLTPDTPYLLARLISRFPEVARRAEVYKSPHMIAQYLTQLASEWNSFYAQERILGGEFESHKVKMIEAYVTTMKNGLGLMGISVPEKM